MDVAQKRDVEGMGIPEIKYGESMCFVQHVSTGLWLTYAALDAKAARLGMMKRKVGVYIDLMKTIAMNQQYMPEKIRAVRQYCCPLLGHSAPGGSYGRRSNSVPFSDRRVPGCSYDLQHRWPLPAVHQVN